MDNTYFIWAGGLLAVMGIITFLGRFLFTKFDDTKLGKKFDNLDLNGFKWMVIISTSIISLIILIIFMLCKFGIIKGQL